MARKSRSIGELISAFKLMAKGLKNNSKDFVFLQKEIKIYEDKITQLEESNAGQEKLKADLKSKTKEVRDLQKELKTSYASFTRYAKAKYGPTAAKLSEFISATEGTTKSKSGKKSASKKSGE